MFVFRKSAVATLTPAQVKHATAMAHAIFACLTCTESSRRAMHRARWRTHMLTHMCESCHERLYEYEYNDTHEYTTNIEGQLYIQEVTMN
jgi:hypothetical protein